MATLNSYITQVQNLLHDANANFWTTTQLTSYINEARDRTARDTGCLRNIQNTYTPLAAGGIAAQPWVANTAVTAGSYIFSNIFMYEYVVSGTSGSSPPPYPSATNVYPPAAPTAIPDGTATLNYAGQAEIIPYTYLPQNLSGTETFDVLGINLYWGNSRIPLRYLPWSNFTAQLRYWQNYVGRPICFSIYGQNQIYIAPVPDQSYAIEIDTQYLPTDLTLTAPNITDVINDPYTTCVQYYAAYKAKFYEQSYGESEIFKQQYNQHVRDVLNSTFTRRIPDTYSNPF